MNILISVPVRERSERLLYKSVKVLGDRPLYAHALDKAVLVKEILEQEDEHKVTVVLDSDSEQYRSFAKHYYNVEVLERPFELTLPDIALDFVAQWEVANYPDAEILAMLSPTSPFFKVSNIVDAIRTLIGLEKVNSIISAIQERKYFWLGDKCNYISDEGRIMKHQDVNPFVRETNGLYVVKTSFIKAHGAHHALHNTWFLEVSPIEAVDIGDEGEWELAELLYKGINA